MTKRTETDWYTIMRAQDEAARAIERSRAAAQRKVDEAWEEHRTLRAEVEADLKQLKWDLRGKA